MGLEWYWGRRLFKAALSHRSNPRHVNSVWVAIKHLRFIHELPDVENVYFLDQIYAVELTSNKITELIGWQDRGKLGNMIATPHPFPEPSHNTPHHVYWCTVLIIVDC